MTAGTYNISIEQGATWTLTLTFKDSSGVVIDVSSYTFTSQIRLSKDSPEKLADMTQGSGIDVTNAATGIIVLSLTATETAALDFIDAVWDIESLVGSVVTREVEGTVTLNKEVTR